MFWHIKVRRAQTSVPQCICPNINFYLSGHCFSCSLTEISDGQTMSMASHKLLCHWFHTFWKTISHWLTARLYITCQMNKYLFNNPTKYNQLKEFFFLLPHLFAKNDLVEKISANVSTGKDRDRQTGIRANTSQQISQILAHNHMVAVVSSSQTSRLRSIRN